ncbi:MAG: short-chain dehydrogenase/reductase [Microbacteriaceae bacterium]|nr:short-chain dehydrogenase/reductase [Microbacteriaceae bacterium]
MTGRVVIVTGASQGIGRATAEAFARAGDAVVATSRQVPTDGASHSEGLGVIVTMALDVTVDSSVASLVERVEARYGRIDVLVNNAGRGFSGSTGELQLEAIQESLDINFLGAVRMTKAVLPGMRRAQHGRIIAVSSIGGVIGQPFNDAYCSAKFALEGLFESLHPVAAQFGIGVSLVEPGPVASAHRGLAARAVSDDEKMEVLMSSHRARSERSFASAQRPEEVAATILAVAESEDPALRYQTSDYSRRMVGVKLHDVTGSQVTTMTAGWISGAWDDRVRNQ